MKNISFWLAVIFFSVNALVAVERRPNVIILIADQLRYQSLGYAGDPLAHTPNIDQLASQGMDFRQFVANTPVCSAFRASLLTGKYASSTGIVVNELRLNPNQESLAHVFKKAGYKADHIGKWHLWANMAGGHNSIGNAYTPPGPYRMGFDDFWAAYNFNHNNFQMAYFRDSAEPVHIDGFGAEHFSSLAIERIQHHARQAEPFLMTVAYSPPHDPWVESNVPEKWYKHFKKVAFEKPSTWSDSPDPRMDRHTDPEKWRSYWKPQIEEFMRVYYAMNAALDEQIGRVIKAVDDAGISDHTIIVFTSDHGEMFGAHGRVFKMTFYEESCRVPFLVRYPDAVEAGGISDAPMSTVDILPTLAGLCNAPVPSQVEGNDFSPILLGQPGAKLPDYALLQGMGHTYLWKDGFEWRALRNKDYTYARYLSDGKELLFNNSSDPFQIRDLSGLAEHAEVLHDMRARMNQRMLSIQDPFKPCSWYRDHWIENRVVMRAARGPFHRESSPDVKVDTEYQSAPVSSTIRPRK